MIAFICVQCARPLQAADDLAGKTTRCLSCQTVQPVPGDAATLPSASMLENLQTLAAGPSVLEVRTLPPSALSEQATVDHVSAPLPESDFLPPASASPNSTPTGTTIPGYEVLSELGRGGMGVVYKARQTKLHRLVALKMILSGGQAGATDLARFQTEAEAIARLQHPNIVQVYEVGEHEGKPFFSLEFCSGGSLEKKLNGTPLPACEAAQLVETLARAMQAAHEQHIVHRDLKPANVLLLEDGTPKITDFGLAKKLDEASQTQSGAIMGTPSYMAPEQASGHAAGPLADVYALGAILYQCLTGRPPFKSATAMDTIMQVVMDEPVPPTQLQSKTPRDLETICLKCLHKKPEQRYASAKMLADDLRRWLKGEPIVARRVGRVERAVKWVRRNPVPATAVASIVAMAVIAFALIASSRSNALVLAEEKGKLAENNAQLAREKGHLAEEKGTLADANAKLAAKEKQAREDTEKALKREEHERKQKEAELLLARSNMLTGQLLRAKASSEQDPAQALQLLHDYNSCPIDLRDAAWQLLENACRSRAPVTLAKKGKAFDGAAFLPDGTLVSTNMDGTISVWDLATAKERPLVRDQSVRPIQSGLAVGGDLIAVFSNDGVSLWDAQTGKARGSLPSFPTPPVPVRPIAFSGDGKMLVTASSLPVSSVTGPASMIGLAGSGHPAGPMLAASSLTPGFPNRRYLGMVYLWDPSTRRQRAAFPCNTEFIWSVAISPDGRTVACGENDQVRVWDVDSGTERAVFKGHKGPVSALAFSANNRALVSGDRGGSVQFWEIATGKSLGALGGQRGNVRCLAFSPDGRSLALGTDEANQMPRYEINTSTPGVVQVFDLVSNRGSVTLGKHAGGVRAVAFSPDGRSLVSAGGDERLPGRAVTQTTPGEPAELRLWQFNPRLEKLVLKDHKEWINSVALSPGGRFLASAGDDQTIRLWDLESGKVVARLEGHATGVWCVAYSPDGKVVAGVGADKVVRLWDADTGKARKPLTGHEGAIRSVAFSPDGKTLATGSEDKTVRLWDVDTGKERAVLNGLRQAVFCIAFSPDGTLLVSGGGGGALAKPGGGLNDFPGRGKEGVGAASVSGELRLWDVQAAKERAVLYGQSSTVHCVAFSPDGQTLASGSGIWDDQRKVWLGSELRLWEVAGGRGKAVLANQPAPIWALAFSPDGRSLVSGGGDGILRLRDALTGQERAALLAQSETPSKMRQHFDKMGQFLEVRGHGPTGAVWSVGFSPDGRTLACGGADGMVRTWDLSGNTQRAVFPGHGESVSLVAFSPDGKVFASASGSSMRLRDAASGRELTIFRGKETWSRVAAVSPDLRALVNKSMGLNVLDLETGQERTFKDSSGVFVAASVFSPDGKTLAVTSMDLGVGDKEGAKHLRLWDVATGQLKRKLPDQTGGIAALAWSPDGKVVATGDHTAGVVRLWDVETAKEQAVLKADKQMIISLTYSRDGKLLAAGDWVGVVRVWDVTSGQVLAVLEGHPGPVWSVAFSPDGKLLASGSGPEPRRGTVEASFPDPQVGNSEGEVRLHEVSGWRQQAVFRGHTGRVRSVAFSPDGKMLASGSEDQTVRLWEIRPQ